MIFFCRMASCKSIIVVLAACIGAALAYSSGAPLVGSKGPTAVCQALLPEHGPTKPQPGQGPFSYVVNQKQSATIKSGQTVTVKVVGQDAAGMTGFLIQGREVGGHMPVGTIAAIDNQNSQVLKCGGQQEVG